MDTMTATRPVPSFLAPHPAPYSKELIPVMARLLLGHRRIHDPFAGTGRIFQLEPLLPGAVISASELQPRWAAYHPKTEIGDATDLPYPDGAFDAFCTSPCLAHGHRILRRDLRWIPVEEIKEGDEVIAFDEHSPFAKSDGRPARRKWRIATVLRSVTRSVCCLRIRLSNGDCITCTPEHPWLAQRYKTGGNRIVGDVQWVQAKDLMTSDTYTRRVHGKWMQIDKKSTGWWVHKQLEVWKDDRTYEAGWLAGIFDGEGYFSFGQHGTPHLAITQAEGPIADLIKARLNSFGFSYNVYQQQNRPEHRKPVVDIIINGGFPGVLKALGMLQPSRLISKLDKLSLESRSIQAPEKVQVVAIEAAGLQNIQEIETSTGTYIGEGYLHHNCYGNRMADSHNAQDDSHRVTYTHYYGEPLHPNNAGAMPWGDKWRDLHTKAFAEIKRMLCPGGAFVLNIKDFIKTVPASKAGEPYYERSESQTSKSGVQVRVRVTDWCVDVCRGLGFQVVEREDVDCPGMRKGQNGAARIPYETVIKFQLGTQRQEQHFSMSRTYEWGTPGYIVDMARQVLGGIDLDPASSALWNMATVRATTYWGLFDWGLRREWFGRVFMNPPFGKYRGASNLQLWSHKLIQEYDAGRVQAGIMVVTDAMCDKWMKPIKERFPICLPDGRVSFIGEDGKPIPGNTKGTALVYLGPEERRFADVFGELGTVMKAIH
jgi:hypothetical protein